MTETKGNSGGNRLPGKSEPRSLESIRSQLGKMGKRIESDLGTTTKSKWVRQTVAYLLIDCSTSMQGDRMEQGQKGAVEFYRESTRQGCGVGLISFESYASLVFKPAEAPETVERLIERLLTAGSTNMTHAITMATELLTEDEGTPVAGHKVICIVTDGEPNDPSSALDAGRQASEKGIEIVTIGVDGADEDFLSQISTRPDISGMFSAKQLEGALVNVATALALEAPSSPE